MSIEAMKQALEAFCFMPNEIVTQSGVQVAMSSLRQAIAEAENARELELDYTADLNPKAVFPFPSEPRIDR